MKHETIDYVALLKEWLPEKLEKDLEDNEVICPLCHGLAVVERNKVFGIDDEKSDIAWYKNQYILPCPVCYNGVVRQCEYCHRIIPRTKSFCDCSFQQEIDNRKKIEEQKKLAKDAKEITWNEAADMLFDEKSQKYFENDEDFTEYYKEMYYEDISERESNMSFHEYFKKCIPQILWNCKVEYISVDIQSWLEDACWYLHEDALNNIDDADKDELQNYVDEWCKKQTGTATYYPRYDEYIKVEESWFGKGI